jgi:hypothetical protein
MKMWRAKHEFLEGKKKEKAIGNVSEVRRLHASYKERKEANMNLMTRHDNIVNHHIQPYILLERGGMINVLMHAIHTSNAYCIFLFKNK